MESGTSNEEKAGPCGKRLEKALEHPVRAMILAELRKGSVSPSELVDILGLPPAQTAYHYRVLERLGGIRTADESQ